VAGKGGSSLFRYYHSLGEALQALYSDFAWQPSRFGGPKAKGYWQAPGNIVQRLTAVEKELGINQVSHSLFLTLHSTPNTTPTLTLITIAWGLVLGCVDGLERFGVPQEILSHDSKRGSEAKISRIWMEWHLPPQGTTCPTKAIGESHPNLIRCKYIPLPQFFLFLEWD